jgi:Polycystin cation channel
MTTFCSFCFRNINRFSVNSHVIQYPVSGEVLPWHSNFIVKLVPYELPSDFLLLTLEICLLIAWIVNVVREIYQLVNAPTTYKGDFWNVADVTSLVLVAILAVLRIVTSGIGSALRARIDQKIDTEFERAVNFTQTSDQNDEQSALFEPMWRMGFLQAREREIAALLLIVTWFTLLKFLRLHPDIGILLRIIKKELRDASIFLVVYLAVLFGFAVAFHMLVGVHYHDFRTVWSSTYALFRLSIGDFKTYSFGSTGDYLAFVLFILYLAISVILLLNLLIAMLNQSYANVYEEASLEYLSERAKVIQSYSIREWRDKAKKSKKDKRAEAALVQEDDETALLTRIAEALNINVFIDDDTPAADPHAIIGTLYVSNAKLDGENGRLKLVDISSSGRTELRFESKAKKNDHATTSIGIVMGCNVESAGSKKRFKLSTPQGDLYMFSCDKAEIAREWVSTLTSSIKRAPPNLSEFDGPKKTALNSRMQLFQAHDSHDSSTPFTPRAQLLSSSRKPACTNHGVIADRGGKKSIVASSVQDVPGHDFGQKFHVPAVNLHNQPRTKNIPFSYVMVDVGEDRRLFPTSISMEFLPQDGALMPQQFVLQGSNSTAAFQLGSPPKVGRHLTQPALSPETTQCDDDDIARKVLDLRWTTLCVYVHSCLDDAERISEEGSERSCWAASHSRKKATRINVPCWAGLPEIIESKAGAGRFVPAFFILLSFRSDIR